MITPVFTEKSLKLARSGKYSFWVERTAAKAEIKTEINKVFGVHVNDINTITTHGEARRNNKGRNYTVLSTKKAIVTLKDGEKIEVFEEPKK